MMPLVSIITITYNHEKFISRCIQSVQNQTYANFEHIIIDDASTDNTQAMVERFNDKRIRYVRHKDNYGIWNLKASYNQALNMAKGEYVAILEGDDYFPKDKLEYQINNFDDDAIFTFGRMVMVDKNNIPFGIFPIRNLTFNIRTHLKDCWIPAATVMVRKEALLKIGGFQQNKWDFYVDYPTWLKLVATGKFVYLNHVLGYYCLYGQNASLLYKNKVKTEMDCRYAYQRWPEITRKNSGFGSTMFTLHHTFRLVRMKLFYLLYKKTANGVSFTFPGYLLYKIVIWG